MATRYKLTKDQLERIVENFVMESASIEGKKAPVKNHIPSQSTDAKKHIKNKISGDLVEPSEGVPVKPPVMKKKLSQSADAKKHVSNAKSKLTTKAKVVKEEVIEEGRSPEELKADAERMWKDGSDNILKTIVNKWKSNKENSFGEWAKQYFKGGDTKKALMSILDYQKNKFIEAFVKGGGSALGGFDYITGEYKPGKTTGRVSFGGGLF